MNEIAMTEELENITGGGFAVGPEPVGPFHGPIYCLNGSVGTWWGGVPTCGQPIVPLGVD